MLQLQPTERILTIKRGPGDRDLRGTEPVLFQCHSVLRSRLGATYPAVQRFGFDLKPGDYTVQADGFIRTITGKAVMPSIHCLEGGQMEREFTMVYDVIARSGFMQVMN